MTLVTDASEVIVVTATERGPTGLSAYDLAVKGGYVGTEQEWLLTLGSGSDVVIGRTVATAGQTVFTVDGYLPTTGSLVVFRGGILQDVTADYTETSPTSITLLDAAVENEIISWRVYSLGPGNQLVFSDALTATSNGQTVFNLVNITYVVGTRQLLVFHNGSLLENVTDYAETSTTSFTIDSSYASRIRDGDSLYCLSGAPTTTDAFSSSTVAYDQGGTGAVPTDVQTKLQEFVSVKDFGATGDGVTDDTAAIQAAIDFFHNADTQKDGGALYFPKGIYLTGALTVSNAMTFRGDGVTSRLSLATAADAYMFTITSTTFMYDMFLDANAAAQTPGAVSGCVSLTAGADFSTFTNCRFQEAEEYGVYMSGGNQYSFYGCQFRNCTDAGAYVANAVAVAFSGACIFEDNTDKGLWIAGSTSSCGVIVRDSYFENNGVYHVYCAGMQSHQMGNQGNTDVAIQDNYMNGNATATTHYGIYVAGVCPSGMRVNGNQFRDCDLGAFDLGTISGGRGKNDFTGNSYRTWYEAGDVNTPIWSTGSTDKTGFNIGEGSHRSAGFRNARHSPPGRLWFPVRYTAADNQLSSLTDSATGGPTAYLGDSINYEALAGQTSLVSGTYKWTLSTGGGTAEYYCELAGGGDPSLGNPSAYGAIYENAVKMVNGTGTSLAASEWDYGDFDTLGYSTIYVRLADDTDPDTKAAAYVELGLRSETNKIDMPGWASVNPGYAAKQDMLVRILMANNLQTDFAIQFFDSAAASISYLSKTSFGAGADTNKDTGSPGLTWVSLIVLAAEIPDAASQFVLHFVDQHSEDAFVYSIEAHSLGASSSAPRHPGYSPDLPFKGWSTNKLNGTFAWFHTTTGAAITYSGVYDYLVAQLDRYQGNGFRLTIGIDDGWDRVANGDYNATTAPYEAIPLRNLRFVLTACEALDIKFIPVLIYPTSASTDTQFPDVSLITNSTVADSYEEAVKDIIKYCEGFSCVWGYDLISESADSLKTATPESYTAPDTYTPAQITAAWENLATAARTVTNKPLIYSMADGFRGPMSLSHLDFTLVDAVDYHGYNRPWRFPTATYYPYGFIPLSLEIGHANATTDEDDEAHESEQALHEAAAHACAAWAWAPRFYDEGSSANSAKSMTRYQQS